MVGFVGRGGMGEVYAAYDPELNRRIAIKLLRTREDSPVDAKVNDRRTRLLREAQAIARLSHPNVVVVHDVGTFGDSVFIAMEYIDGQTLRAWMAASRRGHREVLEVFLAAGHGLAAAHAAGLVHRDFKPDNVMIGKDGQIRVMDFGIARESLFEGRAPHAAKADAVPSEAKALTQSSSDYLQVNLTATGAFLGTPAYAAPEQLMGAVADARVDQFSFCVALYEALYGQRPFAGSNVVVLAENVMAGKVRAAEPEAHVPTWLRRAVVRGLSADPDGRYPTMAELFAALQRDPSRTRRRALGATLVVLLAAGAATAAHRASVSRQATCAGAAQHTAALWGPSERRSIQRAFAASGNAGALQAFGAVGELFDRFVARWNGMYTEACEATQLRGEQSHEVLDLRMECLNERLAGLHAMVDVFRNASTTVVDNAVTAASALPSLDRCADVAMLRAVIRPPDDPAVRARVTTLREELANVSALSMAGQCDRALPRSRSAVEQATKLGYEPVKAEALYALGSSYLCDDLAERDQILEGALLAAESSRHDEIAVRASATIEGADLQMSKYWIDHAQAILSRFPKRHPVLEAWIATGKANVLYEGGDHEGALPEARRALALKTEALGAVHVDTAISQMQVANVLHALGRDAEAEPTIRRALEVFAKVLGQGNSRVAVALGDLGESLGALGRFDEAHRALDQARAIWDSLDAGPFPKGLSALALGRLQIAEHHPREASVTLGKALDALRPFSASVSGARFGAEAEFALARALWPFPEERASAVAHARGALAVLEKARFPRPRTAPIVAWLETHDGPAAPKTVASGDGR